MPPEAVVVVGASAGGVEALRTLMSGLPAGFDGAVLVVLHIPRGSPSALANILARSGPLPARHAVNGESLEAGRVYVAPADHHLLVLDGRIRLSRGPSENGHRPAIDPLFRSAARTWGARTVAVVLSGTGDDGTYGAAAVAARGGHVLVQHPDDALYRRMPGSVIDQVDVDQVLNAGELGPAVAELVKALAESPDSAAPAVPPSEPPDQRPVALETAMAKMEELTTEEPPTGPSDLACPSCHGALFELPGQPGPRFRFRVGHTWSPNSLLDEQPDAFESALWAALRSLEEKASLSRRMATSARVRGTTHVADRYISTAAEAEEAGKLIRTLIARLGDFGNSGTELEQVE
jgi:two-component system, chemotaxis family, protein-glutamate methylesterase/glutaminase